MDPWDVKMFTLGSTFHKWKWVQSPFERLHCRYVVKYGYLIIKGVIHFVCSGTYENDTTDSGIIVSFDTAREKFYKSTVPSRYYSEVDALLEIQGCPSFVVQNEEAQSRELCQWNIWALKDLDGGEWHKLYSVNLVEQGWHYSDVLATLENGRFFILRGRENNGNVYFVYDVKSQQLTSLKLKREVLYSFLPYVESLIPCPHS